MTQLFVMMIPSVSVAQEFFGICDLSTIQFQKILTNFVYLYLNP